MRVAQRVHSLWRRFGERYARQALSRWLASPEGQQRLAHDMATMNESVTGDHLAALEEHIVFGAGADLGVAGQRIRELKEQPAARQRARTRKP